MTGSDSIDIRLSSIWHSWFAYRKSKKSSPELHEFQYNLEINLYELFQDLNNGTYKHGSYKSFIVSDNKKREISVAPIRDRVIHRLLYDYLVEIFDKTFVYDAWSCRNGKGLTAAIKRCQKFFKTYRDSFVWRADIKKFFDNVDQKILLNLILRRAKST